MGCGASSTAAEDRYLMGSGPEPTVDRAQGEPPHIKALTYKVHDVLPGTEASIDLGEWGGN